MTTLIPDPLVSEATGLHIDVIRNLIRARAITPALSPRGRGKTRMWSHSKFLRLAAISGVMQLGETAVVAATICNEINDKELNEIYEGQRGHRQKRVPEWSLSILDGQSAILESPDNKNEGPWVNGRRLLAEYNFQKKKWQSAALYLSAPEPASRNELDELGLERAQSKVSGFEFGRRNQLNLTAIITGASERLSYAWLRSSPRSPGAKSAT